jgi:putative transposase
MPRLARVVVPHYPHHIVQRGNRRQDVFFKTGDYTHYLSLLKQWTEEEGIEVLAYCLMTNHVHLVVVPSDESNLSRAIGETHRGYTRMVNFRENWTGYLWQGRFNSYVLDENWLLSTLAYVELNPVKAGMVKHAWNYRWSSVHAHIKGYDEFGLVSAEGLAKCVEITDWKRYLLESTRQDTTQIAQHARTGRPLGSPDFITQVGKLLGRDLKKKKPGPKKE